MFRFIHEKSSFRKVERLFKEGEESVAIFQQAAMEHLSHAHEKHCFRALSLKPDIKALAHSQKILKESLLKEWEELYQCFKTILTEQTLNFDPIYKLAKQLIALDKKHASNIIFWDEKYNGLIIALTTLHKPKPKIASIINTSTSLIETQKLFATSYSDLLKNLLGGVLRTLALYFDKSFKEFKIAILDTDTIETICQKLTQEVNLANKTLIGKIKIQLNLAETLPTNPIFATFIGRIKTEFFNFEQDIKTLGEKLQQIDVIRTHYLRQDFDHVNYFTPGYCELDIDEWLAEKIEVAATAQAPTFAQYSDLAKELQLYRGDPLFLQKIINGPDIHYLMGKDFWREPRADKLALVEQLLQDIQFTFGHLEATALKLNLGVMIAETGHALGIKKCLQSQGFFFRDVNHGVFFIKDLPTLLKFLPMYLEHMGYSKMFASYFIEFINPNYRIENLEKDEYYLLFKSFLTRLRRQPGKEARQLLKEMEKNEANEAKESKEEAEWVNSQLLNRYSILDDAMEQALSIEEAGENIRDAIFSSFLKLMKGQSRASILSAMGAEMDECDSESEENESDEDDESWKKLERILPEEYHRLAGITENLTTLVMQNTNVLSDPTSVSIADSMRIRKEAVLNLKKMLIFPLPNTQGLLDNIAEESTDAEFSNFFIKHLCLIIMNEARCSQLKIAIYACRSLEQLYITYDKKIAPLLFAYQLTEKMTDLVGEYLSAHEPPLQTTALALK